MFINNTLLIIKMKDSLFNHPIENIEKEKEKIGHKINYILTANWMFSSWYEKLIIIGLIGFNMYQLLSFIRSLL